MRLAIRGKLFFGFAVVISLGLSSLWIAVHSSNRLLRDALSIVERELPGVALIINADRDAYQSNLGISFALEEVLNAVEANRTLEPAVIEEAVATISDNRDQVRQRFDQFVELFPGGMEDPVFADAVATFNDHYDAWSRITDRLIADIRALDASSHGMYHHGAYSDAFDPMRESMDILTEWTEASAAERSRLAVVDETRASRVLVAVAIALFVGLIVVAWLLLRAITRPLSNLHDALRDVAMGEGDLTKKLDISRRDEVSRVARAFNDFTDTLAEIIGNIQQETHNLTATRDTISHSVEESGAATSVIDSVAERMDELSRGLKHELENFTKSVKTIESMAKGLDGQVHEQVGMVEQSTTAVQEMIASVGNVTKVSQDKGQASRKLLDSAEAGRNRVSESVQAVESINMRVGSVIEMTDIIKRIAGTTNLLAMNAAIEAAHAGESGRGFAVVADEIRKLAENTSGQSRDITTTLGAIVDDVHKAVDISSASQTGYEEMYATIEDVGRAFEEIVASMSELQTGSRQILDAMNSLQSSSTSVRDGSGEIKAETTRLTAGIAAIQQDASETAAAAADLKDKQCRVSNLLSTITAATGDLTESSSQLERKVDRFIIQR